MLLTCIRKLDFPNCQSQDSNLDYLQRVVCATLLKTMTHWQTLIERTKSQPSNSPSTHYKDTSVKYKTIWKKDVTSYLTKRSFLKNKQHAKRTLRIYLRKYLFILWHPQTRQHCLFNGYSHPFTAWKTSHTTQNLDIPYHLLNPCQVKSFTLGHNVTVWQGQSQSFCYFRAFTR